MFYYVSFCKLREKYFILTNPDQSFYMMFAYRNLHVQVELVGGIGQEAMLDGDALRKHSLAPLILL